MTPRRLFFAALFFLATLFSYAVGMWTTYKDWAPWQVTVDAQKLWRSWRATGQFLRDGTYQIRQDYAADEPHTAQRPELAAKGLWVINRFDPVNQRFVTDLIESKDLNLLWQAMLSDPTRAWAQTALHSRARRDNITLAVSEEGAGGEAGFQT